MCVPLLAPLGAALGASAASSAAVGTIAAGSLVSGAVGAYGAYQQGQAGKALNNYQANVLGQQAVLAQRNADQNTTLTQIQGAEDSKVAARKAAAVAGAQTAAMAANGTASGTTASDVKLDTFDTGKLDQMAIQYNADLKSSAIKNNLDSELYGLNAQQKQYRMAAKNSAIAGNIGVGTSLLNSATQIGTIKALYK